MIFTADYHTHTVFSHGKGDVIDNAISAKEKGLKIVGITDHGFNHPAFGLTARKLVPLRQRINEAKSKTGIDVLMGIESNLVGTDGTVDLKPKFYDDFDLFLVGYHKFVMYKFGSYFSLSIPNLFYNFTTKNHAPKRVVKDTTKAFVNAIKKHPIDVITHLNYCCFLDTLEVAKCASDYGTYIELSSKKSHLTDEEINDILVKTDAKFVVNSDAHSPCRVGDFAFAKSIIDRLSINGERIANADGKIPKLRFSTFKSGGGR